MMIKMNTLNIKLKPEQMCMTYSMSQKRPLKKLTGEEVLDSTYSRQRFSPPQRELASYEIWFFEEPVFREK